MQDYKFTYWGPFVLETKVEQEFIDILLEKGNGSRKKNLDHRNKLAGMMDHEYYYEDLESWFIPKFTPYVNFYIDLLKSKWMPSQKTVKEYSVTSLWVNYQKANDYNPLHNHEGDLSFVIYLQVPDEIKKENEEMEGVHNNSGPGKIVFNYGVPVPFSISGFDKLPETGDIIIFPAWLTHYAHAFKSDVERISVSGNVVLNYDLLEQ
tara:strand:+ start:142 stop:762 length:621 start_codon:yes stop_codon:yes gene_type:complete